jgi:hypothetical protein
MERHDVEQIVQGVLTAHGLKASVLSAALIEGTWRVTVSDISGRIITAEIPTSPAAKFRVLVGQWLDREL